MQKIYITSDNNKLYLLNKLRGNNDLDSLVMSISELKKQLIFDYTEETLFYLVSKYHISKEIAKIYLENIYYVNDNNYDNDKVIFLANLKKELEENNLLVVNPLFKEWLKNYELCFYHLVKTNIVNILYLKCSLLTKVWEENIELESNSLVYFKTLKKREEVSNICNLIVDLIKKGVPYEKIYLTNVDEEYRNLFLTYGHFFNLNFSFTMTLNVYSTKIVKYFVKHIKEDWQSIFAELKKNLKNHFEEKVYNALINFANKYLALEVNTEFYNYVLDSLKSLTIKIDIPKNCIRDFDFLTGEVDRDAYIFLVNARESCFPNLVKNYEYLTDKERSNLNLLSILEENQNILQDTIKRLNYYSNLTISLSALDDGKFYLAPVIKENYLKEIDIKPNYENSHLFNKLTFAANMDLYYEYGVWDSSLEQLYPAYKDCSYKSFNHQFKKFNIIKPINTLSYSSLDLYNRCPFRFYLNNVLKINKSNPTFFQSVGNFYHHVLEQFYELDFDFEKLVLEEKNNFSNSKKEEFFFNKLANNLRRVIEEIKRQEAYSSLKNVLCEVKIEVLLNHDIIFKGFIDKFYYDEQRISVIDYKTGSPKIDFNLINYGIGMQLPIYAYLLSKSQFKDYELVGFYLQKVIPSLVSADLKHQRKELEEKEYYLEGYSISDEEALSKFDSSYFDSKVIKGLKKSAKGFYKYAKVMSKDELAKMNLFTEQKIKETVEEIFNGNFKIAPKNIGNKNVGCEFCPYEAICNYDGLDIVYEKIVKPDFIGGEDDELLSDAVASN